MKLKDKIERFKKQPKYLKKYTESLANPESFSIYTESENYCIIKMDGGTYWNGVSSNYCQSCYELTLKTEASKGYWYCSKMELHRGRVTKKDKEMILNTLKNHEETYVK